MFAVTIIIGFILCIVNASDGDLQCPDKFIDAVRSGSWSCAKQIADTGASVDMRSALDLESRVMLKELNDLKKHLESNLPVAEIHPAFQWAQSENDIFLSIKFAHKLDTPGTLNVEAQNVTLTNDSLYLFATNGRKNFVLSIDFLRDIDPDSATWSMASVGRMSITMKKKTINSKWARLHRDRSKKVSNQHFWWDKHESFANALDKLPEQHKSDKDNVIDADVNPDLDAKTTTDSTNTEVKSDSNENQEKTDSDSTTTTATINKEKVPIDPRTKEYKISVKKINKEHKSNLSAMETELKSKKNDIDVDCKKQKESIDTIYNDKKKVAIEEWSQLKNELKTNYQKELNSVTQEL